MKPLEPVPAGFPAYDKKNSRNVYLLKNARMASDGSIDPSNAVFVGDGLNGDTSQHYYATWGDLEEGHRGLASGPTNEELLRQLTAVGGRLDTLIVRLDAIDVQLTAMDRLIDALDNRLGKLKL